MSQKKLLGFADPIRLRQAWINLILKVFRVNADLIAAGDNLVGDLGLTSARWQVLGAIALSPVPLPVAYIARNMGLTRQAVQRLVGEMRADGLVRLEPNPHHRRAVLVVMTQRGEGVYQTASERQEKWADALASGLPAEAFEVASALLGEMQCRLDEAATLRVKSKAQTVGVRNL